MFTAIDKAIKDAQEKIKNIQAYIQVLERLPSPPEGCSLFVSDNGRVFVDIPYNFEIYRLYRQQLAKADWIATMVYGVGENGKRYTDLMNSDGERLSLVMNPQLQGSACQLVQVGEEIKPVYRVQCR